MTVMAFTNCSKVGFKATDGSSDGSSLSGSSGGGSNGGAGANGNTNGIGSNVGGSIGQPAAPGNTSGSGVVNPDPSAGLPASLLPKLQFISPACNHLSMCSITFQLDKVYSEVTQFDWQTNDTLYMTPHYPVYAQPNLHYIPTGGHVVFQPGETSKTVYVQNINSANYQVIIGVLLSACQFGPGYESCMKFFPNL
jgi:hypothetical protein